MSYQILTTTAASITDLKKNPMGTVAEGEGDAVVILNRNEPAFYCVPQNFTPIIGNSLKMPN